jgi:methionyl-tRNA formyltransferase
MLLRHAVPIEATDTTASLHDKLATLGGTMIVDALRRLRQLAPVPQPQEGVTYAPKIVKEEAALDFTQAAVVLDRKIRAFNPFPGASATVNGALLKLWRAEPAGAAGALGAPGEVLAANADGVVIACGNGALRVRELQKAGSKRLPAAEFLKGFQLEGAVFS